METPAARPALLLPLFAGNLALAHAILLLAWDWLTRRRSPVPPADFVLYTRKGCHLCDQARSVLEAAGRRYPLTVRSVDVDADPALAEKYGLEVPVVMIDGRVRFRGRVNLVLLERLLGQRARASSRLNADR